MRTFQLFVSAALGPLLVIFILLFLYDEVADAVSKAMNKGRVPFSMLVEQVEMGHVSEIAVRGRVYTFEVNSSGRPSEKQWAYGPAVTREELLAWHPSDPSLPAPHIVGP